MDPDVALTTFWVARDKKAQERATTGSITNELWWANQAINAAADLFRWLAEGNHAPDWARHPR